MQSITDVPLSIDSSIVAALEAGLAVYQGKALVNSVTGEDERLEQVLPLVAKYGAAVVAISNDETGHLRGSRRALRGGREDRAPRGRTTASPKEDIVVDPLVMPIGAMGTAGRQVFALVRRLHEELGVNTTCGASNVSFGLPNRHTLNAAFLHDGDRVGADLGDHEPAARGGARRRDGRRRDDGQRPGLRAWIARFREQPAGAGGGRRGGRAGRRGGERRRRRGATRTVSAEPEALVVFTPSGKRGRFAHGTTVLDGRALARRRPRLGLRRARDLRPLPGGRRARASSRSTGSARRRSISRPFSMLEQTYRDRPGSAPERRLGCHAQVAGDLVVDVPPESQVHRQVVRKEADAHAIEVDPVVRLHYVEVREPDMRDPSGDLGRLLEALEREWALTGLACDDHVLAGLQRDAPRGRAGRSPSRCTTARRSSRVWPGFHDRALGHRVRHRLDDGRRATSATSRAATCSRSSGAMNPQIRFGEDLMSRVSYVMMNPGAEKQLTEVVRGCVDELTAELVRAGAMPTRRRPRGHASSATRSCITCCSASTRPSSAARRSRSPTDGAVHRRATELGPARPPGRARVRAAVHRRARRRGHGRGDPLRGAVPAGDVNLIVDVGTNAEIVLGNRDRLLAASSPTGPAFEGAQISCGQRAAPGAIERVRIDEQTLEPRFTVIGDDRWSDEPGFDASTVTGVCGSGIIEVIAEMYLAGILTTDGVIDGALAARTPRIVAGRPHVLLRACTTASRAWSSRRTTSAQIQLAKAALLRRDAGC